MMDAPTQVLMVGFYDLNPAQAALANALAGAGAEVRWVTLEGAGSSRCRVQARDPEDEYRLAAQWARQVLENHPDAQVGIVAPDISAARVSLSRALSDALDPAGVQPGHAGRSRAWNFSLGVPLSGYPVIETALHLLSLAGRAITMETVGALLSSPWWAMPDEAEHHSSELIRRALLDARLRKKHGQPRVSLRNLKYFAGEADKHGEPRPWSVPRIRRAVSSLERLKAEWKGQASAAGWAHRFTAWLKAAGWCTGSRLDSAAYQAVEKWQELLATLSTLDEFEPALSLDRALALVRRLASETLFQPKMADAPVQVLGLLEANEQRFDAQWVLGLHDGRWPQPVTPDPFIPLSLQRAHGLPGCDPALELARARQITMQLAVAAPTVVFSHARADGDEELRPSPLIRNFPVVADEDAAGPAPDSWRALIQASTGLESLQAHAPLPFAGGRARGGSQLFKHQSACAFRAFAEHRLGAHDLDAPSLGLDPAERGSLAHKVLECFWHVTESHAALLALSPAELAERVAQSVATAIAERSRQLEWQPQLSGIERQRLASQAVQWLEMEKARAPFKVRGLEHKQRLEFGPLWIDTKIDRIDLLEDGRLVVIDYKTGKVTPSGWFSERPDDPQLPLYTRLDFPEPLAGVVFGVLRADEQKFSGVVEEAELLPGLPVRGNSEAAKASENWPEVLTQWSAVCEGLAEDFMAGHATVNPKQGPVTCDKSYCGLAPLCRIHTAVDALVPGDEP
jgi:probable DNA repair protein